MATRVQRKAHYHHGELREALISAMRQLVEQRGAENFTLADACRVAGVTTGAPIVTSVVSRRSSRRSPHAASTNCAQNRGRLWLQRVKATQEAIIAMGQAYVGFAVE